MDRSANISPKSPLLPMGGEGALSGTMIDQRTSRAGKDRTRIDIGDDHDLRYWSRRFDVSRNEIRRAVETVGALAEDVARHLGKELKP